MSDESAARGAPTKLARGIVARGRSVVVPHPTQRMVSGQDAEGKTIKRPVMGEYGPGQEVQLPEDEIKTLRAGGFLVDPAAPALVHGEGPSYTETGRGESAKTVAATT